MHSSWILISVAPIAQALTIPKVLRDYIPAIVKRDDPPPNPYDQSWVTSYAAIGDSYSAGIGVGDVIDQTCSRYSGGFPQLIDATLFTDPKVKNIACSGATTKDVLSQVSQLDDNSLDLITVSAGGNDVGFNAVTKACVYLTTTQDACDKAISDASNAIDGMKTGIDNVLQALAPKLTKQGLIVYVPYAKFWNEESNYCDDITWAYWDPLGIAGGLKLTADNRQKMNKLTDDVNNAIRQVVASATSSTRQPIPIQIAEWEKGVQDLQGYFCADIDSQDASAGDDILMFIRQNGSPYPSATASQKLRYVRRQQSDTDPTSSDPASSDPTSSDPTSSDQTSSDSNPADNADTSAPVDPSQSSPVPASSDDSTTSDSTNSGDGTAADSSNPVTDSSDPTNPSSSGDTSNSSDSATPVDSSDPSASSTPPDSSNPSDGSDSTNSSTTTASGANFLALPDTILKPFHPSSQGHQTIADAIYAGLILGRAKSLNVDPKNLPRSCSNDPSDPNDPNDPSNPAPSNGLTCFTGDQANWKANNSWTNQPAAAAAAAKFCAGGKQNVNAPSGDLANGKYFVQNTFWTGTANELDLRIDIYENKDLSEDDCKKQFTTIIDGCDGNQGDKNPKNLKYGGMLDYDNGKDGGMVFTFQPKTNKVGQSQNFCDDVNDQTFMDSNVLGQNADTFCKFITDPSSNAGSFPSQTYNGGSLNEVVIKANWPDAGFPPTIDECNDALGQLNNGCQVPSGDSNPSNFKHGGHLILNTDTLFSIQPQKNNTITDGTNFGHTSTVKTHYGDTGQNNKHIDKPTLQNCLRGFATSDWTDGTDCNGMVTFYMNRRGDWRSQSDCFNGCKNQVSQQIDLGASSTNCDESSGFVDCWLGFYIAT